MANVFVSYAHEDEALATDLHAWLTNEGHEVFLAGHPRDGIQLGEDWEQRLYERLRWASAVVCLVTSAYVRSQWCIIEVAIARSQGSRLLPLLMEHGVSHELLRSAHWADHASNPTAARVAMSNALEWIDAAGGPGWGGGNPFPGLRAFDADMHPVFFGRADEVDELASMLRAAATTVDRQLVVVVGPTGCGKSSLVRAGLVPTMAMEAEWWTISPFFPGADPMGALAFQLAAAADRLGTKWTLDEVTRRLHEDGGLRSVAQDLLRRASGRGRRRRHLLVVVDQLEELLRRTPKAARASFAGVLAPAPELAGPVHVVATVRPEYLADLLGSPELLALRMQPFPVRPLGRGALRSVIEGPARIAGIEVDEALVTRLVEDTGTGEALPMLAFTLSQLTERAGRGDRLSVKRYEKLGGIGGALRQQADAARAEARVASGRGSDEVIAGLLRLVTVDENGQPTRWRVPRAELPKSALKEMGAFVDRRLVITDTDKSGAALIGVTHESFLSAWPPLAEAIARHATALRMRRAVERAVTDWEHAGRHRSRLWTGDQLAACRADLGARLRPVGSGLAGRLDPRQRVLTTRHVELSSQARDFVVASMGLERRRRARATTILSATLAFVLALASFAFVQQREAYSQRRIATAKELTAEANSLRDSRPDVSLLLSKESEHMVSSTDARASLLGTLLSPYAGTVHGHTGAVNGLAFSPDGRTLATVGADGKVILWAIGDRTRPVHLATPLEGTGPVHGVAYSPDGRTLVTAGDEGPALLWDVSDRAHPRQLASMNGPSRPVNGVAYSPDGRTVATAYPEGTAILWDVHERERPSPLASWVAHKGAVLGVAFGPDGRTLVTAGADIAAILWDIGDPTRPTILATLPGHTDAVLSVAYSPSLDTPMLATASADRTTILWDVHDLAHPAPLATLRSHKGFVSAVAYSRDGRTLTTASADHTAIVWDLGDPTRPTPLTTLHGHTEAVLGVAFNPSDDRVLATASADRTAVIWNVGADLTHPARLDTLRDQKDQVLAAAYSPDGRTLATASSDHTTALWDAVDHAHPLAVLKQHAGSVFGVAFNPRDGRILATASRDGTAILWDVGGDRTQPVPLAALRAHKLDVYGVAYGPDGRTLATASSDGTAILWDVNNPAKPAPLATLRDHSRPVYGVAYSTDGRILATASADDTVILWDLANPHHPVHLATLRGHAGPVYGVTFDPNPRHSPALATASQDGTAMLWDLRDPRHPAPLSTLHGHLGSVNGVAYGPDGLTVSTASADGTAIVWDVSDRTHPVQLATSGHAAVVSAVTYSPDGGTLATASYDHTAALWDVGETTSIAARADSLACAMAGPGLSRTDWDQYISGMSYELICP